MPMLPARIACRRRSSVSCIDWVYNRLVRRTPIQYAGGVRPPAEAANDLTARGDAQKSTSLVGNAPVGALATYASSINARLRHGLLPHRGQVARRRSWRQLAIFRSAA